jgi:hypothetical protein
MRSGWITLEAQLAGLLAKWPEARQRDVAAALIEIADALDRADPAPRRRAAGS